MLISETDMDTIGDTALASFDNPTGLLSPDSSSFADPNDNPEKDHTLIIYLALAIGIIALILAALCFFRKSAPTFPSEFQRLPKQLDELSSRLKYLERQTTDPQIKDAITSLTDIMESVERRVVALENRSKSDIEGH